MNQHYSYLCKDAPLKLEKSEDKFAGKCFILVKYNGKKELLPSYVAKGRGPPLFCRNCLKKIPLDWKAMH